MKATRVTSLSSMEDFSDFVLKLYQLSREAPLGEFQEMALLQLKRAIAFDSSMWGTATSTPLGIDVHTLHLHEQPPEMVEAYAEIKHLDTAAQAVGMLARTTQGFSVADWFGAPHQEPLRAYGRRFGQSNFFITSDTNLDTRFTHWITLFRGRAQDTCTEAERAVLAAVSPHIMQALSFNRIAHLARLQQPHRAHRGQAVSDTRGELYHADTAFHALLHAEWPDWRSATTQLPRRLLAHWESGPVHYVGQHVVLWRSLERGLLFIGARAKVLADGLSARELAVARRVAQGLTHKEIARELDRSPATIRNQIQAIYGKLQVGNIASLVEALRDVE